MSSRNFSPSVLTKDERLLEKLLMSKRDYYEVLEVSPHRYRSRVKERVLVWREVIILIQIKTIPPLKKVQGTIRSLRLCSPTPSSANVMIALDTSVSSSATSLGRSGFAASKTSWRPLGSAMFFGGGRSGGRPHRSERGADLVMISRLHSKKP